MNLAFTALARDELAEARRVYEKRASMYGVFDFRKHCYGSDFESEEKCKSGVHLDILAPKDKIEFWACNLVRREANSICLQNADGRFSQISFASQEMARC